MHKHVNTSTGFTIVELLIVIVVISILATISLVSYSGIQARANNAQTLSMASQYIRALAAYAVVNDAYPPVPSQATPGADDRVCLGVGYEDHDSDTLPDCGNSGFPSIEYGPFNDALRTLVNVPQVTDRPVPTPFQATTFTGVTFIREDAFTVSGQPNPYYIMYVLEGGNSNCGVPVVEQVSELDPFPSMQPSANPWSWSDGATTMCVVALPNV